VTANDIDPYAPAAVAMNAAANSVTVAAREGDLLVGDGGDADVILAGDAFYDAQLAARMLGSCAALPPATRVFSSVIPAVGTCPGG
jgi:predicted nicotinamide N-methyase